MIVLFVLGLLGVKAAVIVYVVYLIARSLTKKGDAIKKGYEDRIAELEKQVKDKRPVFWQSQGKA